MKYQRSLSRTFCIPVLMGLLLLPFWQASATTTEATTNMTTNDMKTAYDFSFEPLIGDEPIALSQFKGKVLLIVNTASKCGFTGQYAGLEKLYETYKDRGLVVIGVPSNDFGQQEPGTNDEIAHFCKLNYGVSFPITDKEDVIGDHAHPFYIWAKKTFGVLGVPKWNFHKYLIDRQGHLVDYFYSTTGPDNGRLIKAIEKLLK